MKKTVFLVVSLILLNFQFSFSGFKNLSAQDIVNLRMDRQQMGLRGNVASMDEDILLRKDYFREDWPERKWFVRDLRNVLREDDGRVITFNKQGRMVTITYTHQGRQGKKTACSYASNGLLTSYVGEGYKVEARYSGSTADINVYAETKDYKTPNLAKADLNQTPYTNSYPFDLKCRQELGDDGLVLKSSYYYVDSMPAKVYEYDYNHLNQLVREKCSDFTSGEKVLSNTRYTYDNQGFLIKKVIHSKAVDETWNYENNEMGDCTRLTIERPYGTIVYTFQYQYDAEGNWTIRLQFKDGIFDCAALRSFSYYEGTSVGSSASLRKKKQNDESSVLSFAFLRKKKQTDESSEALKQQRQADKEARAAAKQAEKEAKAQARADAKAEQKRIKEEEKNMPPEERKAAREKRKAIATAEKEKAAAEKRAAKEKAAAEKRAAKEAKKQQKADNDEGSAASKESSPSKEASASLRKQDKAAKDQDKKAAKAAKDQEKQAAKAAKEQQKLERKAEKEQQKLERKAEKERAAAEK